MMSDVPSMSWCSWIYFTCAAILAAMPSLARIFTAVASGRNAVTNLMNTFVFNLAREDPIVDHVALRLTQGDVVATITTGGDNLLDYLLCDPALVIGVDMNPHQTRLAELKIAAMRCLSQEEFFRIFCSNDFALFLQRFDTISNGLKQASKTYWVEHAEEMRCFALSGVAGWPVKPVLALFWLLGVGSFVHICVDGNLELETQRLLYHERYQWRLQCLTYVMETFCTFLLPFTGVPKRQASLLPPRFLWSSLDYLCRKTVLAENPYYASFALGAFTLGCCPRYMRPECYEVVRSRLDRVKLLDGLFHECLERDCPDGSINKISLLDHLDWLSQEEIAAEWQVLKRKCAPCALIMWRSSSDTQAFEVLRHLKYHISRPILHHDNDEVLPVDRVATYHSIHVASIPERLYFPLLTIPKLNGGGWRSDVSSVMQLWFSGLCGSSFLQNAVSHIAKIGGAHRTSDALEEKVTAHAKWLDDFYGGQAENYDRYRRRMLHGKAKLMRLVPAYSGSRWLDVGGGTGDAVEYLSQEIHRFESVEILDLCSALLDVCERRIRRKGWSNVRTVHDDAVTFLSSRRPGSPPYDIITMSYSLTMMMEHEWKRVVDCVHENLAPGGLFLITDFGVVPEAQTALSAWFWKSTFALDNVKLSAEHLPYIRKKFNLQVSCNHEKGCFPFVPGFIRCLYYYAAFQK